MAICWVSQFFTASKVSTLVCLTKETDKLNMKKNICFERTFKMFHVKHLLKELTTYKRVKLNSNYI